MAETLRVNAWEHEPAPTYWTGDDPFAACEAIQACVNPNHDNEGGFDCGYLPMRLQPQGWDRTRPDDHDLPAGMDEDDARRRGVGR